MWCEACEGSRGFSVEAAELWHEGDEAGSGKGADAWDTGKGPRIAGQRSTRATVYPQRPGRSNLRDTPRSVRGQIDLGKPDKIYRANLRGESTFMRERVEGIKLALAKGDLPLNAADSRLAETRIKVQRAWAVVGDILLSEGQPDLAKQVRYFADTMPRAVTEKQQLASAIRASTVRTRDARQTHRSR